MTTQCFVEALLSHVANDLQVVQTNNVDTWRYPMKPTELFRRRVYDGILSLAAKSGFVRRNSLHAITARFASAIEQTQDLQWLYENLADEYSQQCLIDVLRFKILGNRHVKLPRNTRSFWDLRKIVETTYLKEHQTSLVPPHWELNRYGLHDAGYAVTLECLPLNVITTFGFEQYAYRHSPVVVEAANGGCVVDAGGCWGDTALYFAERVGDQGAVLCFEFVPQNLSILYKNIARNPLLAPRIKVIEHPAWFQSGISLNFVNLGPSTALTEKRHEGGISIKTMSIDDVIKDNNLHGVDFIKMDVEGAELESLQGAINTISCYRPKLAIAVYHRPDDIVRIPRFIDSLDLSYKFYLDHFTIYGEETVLFAIAA